MSQMTTQSLIKAAESTAVDFKTTMQVIDNEYNFTETAFKNGEINNQIGSNNGSCKIFAFARLNQLSEQSTLNLFGDFYTQDVLQNPDNQDHQNIRSFIKHGWDGIVFEKPPLTPKNMY